MTARAASRSWAGTTLADRRLQRRRTLLDVGLELAGTQGSAAVTVRSVCRAAQLTDRYFYESFADRDTFLLAVYDEVVAEAGEVLLGAVARAGAQAPVEQLARLAVDAFLDLLTTDPRKGRMLLLEPMSEAVLAARGQSVTPLFAAIIDGQLAEHGTSDPVQARLTGTALVGAMAQLFIGWLNGSLGVRREVLTDYCVRLLVAATALPASAVGDAAPAAGRGRPGRRR